MTTETSNARGEWVLVPREPTPEMIDAWRDAPDIWECAYAAMLAAAPQPPAEAQAQGGGEVVAYSEKFRASGDWSRYPIGTRAYDIQGGYWERVANGWKWCTGSTFPTPGGDAIYVAVPVRVPAPPSAPVGVERKYPDDGNGDDDAYNRGWNDCLDAIAQQPAAPSETVNVLGMPEFDGLLDHIYEYGTAAEGVIEKANAFARAVIARYAPQQPAAVDGACAAAAIQFALTDPEGMTFLRLWNEGEFDTLRREWPDAPSEVYVGADPLAAQHQEPTT